MRLGIFAKTFPRATVEEVFDAVREAGYASGPYFQTYDVFPPGLVTPLEWRNTYPPEGASHGFPEQLRRDRNGFLDYGWNHIPIEYGDRNWATSEALGSDGAWSKLNSDWRRVESKNMQRWHAELFLRYFCVDGVIIRDPEEGRNALRRGARPDFNNSERAN